MTISIAEVLLQSANKLRRAGVPEARREAGSLLAHVLDRDRSFLLTHAEEPVADADRQKFQDLTERRAQGEPLQYITGRQEFFGLDFEVNGDVLIPRPETELLVENALKLLQHNEDSILLCDVGTGSGCIAVSLLHELPQARAIAFDISPKALQVAKRNAARNSVDDRIEFVVSDCLEALHDSQSPKTFDLIASNPPYVEEQALSGLQREVRDFEPRMALVAGEDGLAVIKRLLLEAPAFLKPKGFLLLEIGFNQHAAVEALIDARVWKLLDIHLDLQGIPRTVALQKL